MKRVCLQCKSEFQLNPRLGINWAEKVGKGKYCSTKCAGLSRRGKHSSPATQFKKTITKSDQRSHPRYSDGIWSYRKWKKDSCTDCGSTDNLFVHHLDENRHNNELDNLRTVCAKCHVNIYHPRKFRGNQYVKV